MSSDTLAENNLEPQRNPTKSRVLIVDDREENLIALAALLQDSEIEVFKARSGRDALELLLQHQFAVALLDVRMPEMDGFELAEFMHGSEKTRDIPIIFVTAGAIDTKFTFQGYEAGAVDFLYKPLDARIVKSKVQVFLRIAAQKQLIENQMKQLESALRVREEFLSIASHELKAPLSSMGLQLQFAQRELRQNPNDVNPELMGKTLNLAHRQVEKIAALIDNLMDVSRIQAGQLTVDKSAVALDKLIRDVASRLQPQLEKAGCEIKLEIVEPVMAPCEEFRVEQVLNNLLSNAAKYAPKSKVTIRLEKKDSWALLTVTDTGPGIATQNLESIFERYERIGTAKSVSGLGLGLYIVRQIMRAHGGEINAQSAPNSGTTFIAKLPLSTQAR